MSFSQSTLPSGQNLLHINNTASSAIISLFGGQLVSWVPSDQKEVIYLSELAIFDGETPIRGGVPICWPWFGNEENRQAHGFVRNMVWEVAQIVDESNYSKVVLNCVHNHPEFEGLLLSILYEIGETLSIQLITHNVSQIAFTITEALHTYLKVSNIANINVGGLSNTRYFDKLTAKFHTETSTKFQFSQETDRIYSTSSSQIVYDLDRKLIIEKEGSADTVVWNPWTERSKAIKDLDSNSYYDFLCIEAANILNPIVINSQQQHVISQRISVESI
jgi:glucose-6-phosphate 1-epimerase